MRYNVSLKWKYDCFFETFPKYLQIMSLPLSPQLVTVSMYNIKAPTKRNIFVSMNIIFCSSLEFLENSCWVRCLKPATRNSGERTIKGDIFL